MSTDPDVIIYLTVKSQIVPGHLSVERWPGSNSARKKLEKKKLYCVDSLPS